MSIQMMTQKNKDLAKERAETAFKRREQQRADAPLAMREYRAAEQAVRDRTKALREQRLAREAAGLRR